MCFSTYVPPYVNVILVTPVNSYVLYSVFRFYINTSSIFL